MTQNEKDLLLQDICSRLPHGIVVATTDNDGTIPNFWMLDSYNRLTEDVRLTNCDVNADCLTYFGDIRPYLFPLSSMTEEQKTSHNFLKYSAYANPVKLVDFYNKHHLDCRSLIPMGLAIDATGLNIY
jgi:hypothetical protein